MDQPDFSDIAARRRHFQRREQTRARVIIAIVTLGGLGLALLLAASLGQS